MTAGHLVGGSQCGADVVEAREDPHGPTRVVVHPPRLMKASIRRMRLGRRPWIQGIVVGLDRPHPAATAADQGARGTLEVQPCYSPDQDRTNKRPNSSHSCAPSLPPSAGKKKKQRN